MKGWIYKYTFPDGKVYIGQTKNIENRTRQHIDLSVGPTNTGFWEAYQRFGKYELEILKELEYDDEDELSYFLTLWENEYIHKYKADKPDSGYNRTSFGVFKSKKENILQKKFWEIYSLYIEEDMKIFDSLKNKIWNSKEPLTDEEKLLVTGRYQEENPFYCKSFDFDNLSNFRLDEHEEMYLDDFLCFVKHMIEEDAKYAVGAYVNEHAEELLKEEMDRTAIVQIDKDGKVVREFVSTTEICQAFNIPRPDNVMNVLKGKQKTAYGYYWKYKRDL